MTEASLVSALRLKLLERLPGAVIFKVHDVTTKGVPDLAVTWRGSTTWVEVKLRRRGQNLRSLTAGPHALQLHTMTSLAKQGQAIYVVYDGASRDKSTIVFEPAALAAEATAHEPEGDDLVALDELQRYGAIRTPHFNHTFVAGLLKELHAQK